MIEWARLNRGLMECVNPFLIAREYMADPIVQKFYNSREWKQTREYIMKRDNYKCKYCVKPANEIHHLIFLNRNNIGDVNITMNPDNLVALCRDCHIRLHEHARLDAMQQSKHWNKHKRLTNEDGTYFDSDGMVQTRRTHIVYGCPRAGKTTYVKEHMEDGDAVVDLDAIVSAFQLNDKRKMDNNLMPLAIKVRDYIIDLVKNNDKSIDCKNVWIIGSFPKKKEREELADALNADLIPMDISIKDAIERAKATNLFSDIDYSCWIVEKWFKAYEP